MFQDRSDTFYEFNEGRGFIATQFSQREVILLRDVLVAVVVVAVLRESEPEGCDMRGRCSFEHCASE